MKTSFETLPDCIPVHASLDSGQAFFPSLSVSGKKNAKKPVPLRLARRMNVVFHCLISEDVYVSMCPQRLTQINQYSGTG